METKKRPVEFVTEKKIKDYEDRKDLPKEEWFNVKKEKGIFHQWGSEIEEGENEVASLTVAIVEDSDGRIHTPIPSDIQFMDK